MPAVQKASLTNGAREGPASKSVSALATWSFLLVHEGTRLPCLRTFIWLKAHHPENITNNRLH